MPAGVLDTSLGDVDENSSCEKLSLFQPKQLFIYLFIYLSIYLFIFTFILSKLEFDLYKSHIYGLFTPVKNTFSNKYNLINTNNESSR